MSSHGSDAPKVRNAPRVCDGGGLGTQKAMRRPDLLRNMMAAMEVSLPKEKWQCKDVPSLFLTGSPDLSNALDIVTPLTPGPVTSNACLKLEFHPCENTTTFINASPASSPAPRPYHPCITQLLI